MAAWKQQAEKAVEAMRVYLGSIDKVRVRDEEKLYRRVRRLTADVAKAAKIDEASVWEQVEDEARRRGTRLAMPGQDI